MGEYGAGLPAVELDDPVHRGGVGVHHAVYLRPDEEHHRSVGRQWDLP